MDLVVARPEGLYCPPGDFYIDPWRPVERSIITHAHGDHARRGNGHYLAAAPGEGILRSRLGRRYSSADPGLRRASRAPRRNPEFSSRRTRTGVGPGASGIPGRNLGRLWGLQGRTGWHLRALRAGALPHLYQRIHLRPTDLLLALPGRDLRRHRRLV